MMVEIEMEFSTALRTSGSGHWTKAKREVDTTRLELLVDDDDRGGELRVYFDDSWSIAEHGLIYTDPRFLRELREQLRHLIGLSSTASMDFDYSEHGMQGHSYVSFDVGEVFLAGWRQRTNENGGPHGR